MVTRDTAWPNGTPCWVDLGVPDIPKALSFYSALLGWKGEPGPPEAGGYAVCELGGRPVAGVGPSMGPEGTPAAWVTYLAADNVDATVKAATSAGAQVLVEPMDVMTVGRMAMISDPGGAVVGLWQARDHKGFGVANEPGAVTWNENMSRDFDKNKTFYQKVFGYTFDDVSSEDMRYSVLKVDGNMVGGIGAMGEQFPAEVPAHWFTYFSVPDADKAVEKLVGLGGTSIAPPFDTPYGRMAPVTDNQGAAFSLIAPPTGAS